MKCKPMFQIAHILCPCIFFLFHFSNELPCSVKDLECNGKSSPPSKVRISRKLSAILGLLKAFVSKIHFPGPAGNFYLQPVKHFLKAMPLLVD